MVTAEAAPPVARFSNLRHVALSIGWFGFNFHWLPISLVLIPNQVLSLTPHSSFGTALGLLTALGAVFAFTLPPAVGAWSDHLRTPWGRRRPILVVGIAFDVVGLLVMMTAASYIQLAVGFVLVQIFNNAAGAAYNGIIPDVVPNEQFGKASGFLAAMNQGGGVVGVATASVLAGLHQTNLTYAVIAVVVALTVVPVLWASKGEGMGPAPARTSRPLLEEVKEFLRPLAFGDFAWVIFTRLMMTAGIWVVANFLLGFFHDVVKAPNAAQFTSLWLVMVYVTATPLGLLGGLLADRFGRKIFVYGSGAFQAVVGLIFIVFYPTATPVLIGLALIYGLGFGLYYAVDWALACDTLPDRANAAKDMGLFHVAFTLPQVVVPAIAGPVLDHFNRQSPNSGYRVIFSAAIVFMALGTAFVTRIKSVR
jgi:MFS family permease